MRYLSSEDLLIGIKLEINDIFNYHNRNYIVKDGMQDCGTCPFPQLFCYKVNCGAGMKIKFQPISEIEALVLKEGLRR